MVQPERARGSSTSSQRYPWDAGVLEDKDTTATDVTIVEVSPRDGLQNEDRILPTEIKIDLIRRLVEAGVRRIEAVSFAHPLRVPAMADAEAVMAGVPRDAGVSYAGLVVNRQGLQRALACGVDEVNVVVCVSDAFSRCNQNMSAAEAMAAATEVIDGARSRGLFTTLTLATAFGCPFEGEVDVDRVLGFAGEAIAAGVDELALADTIGAGTPDQVRGFSTALVATGVDVSTLRFHLHNTRNTGYANALAALVEGVRVLDASVGGIGGCPFAPAATGNIATDDLVFMLERMGRRTGIELKALTAVSDFLSEQLGHEVPALLPRAGTFP